MKDLKYLVYICFAFSFTLFAQDGSYDTTFGSGGTTITDIPGGDEISLLVAENTDGSLWGHGVASLNNANDKILVRYTPNGNFDTSFGVEGVVSLPLAATYTALEAMPDGSMAVAGYFNDDFIVLNYLSDGTLNTSFGTNGIATIDFAKEVYPSLFIEEDSGITIVGQYKDNDEEGVLIASLLPNGILNPDFGTNGIATTIITNEDLLFTFQVSRYPDDSFLVPFRLEDSGKNQIIGFAKILANGTLDTSFGNNGVAVSPIEVQTPRVSAIIREDERILALIHDQGLNAPVSLDSYFAQFLANGDLDTGFGNNGVRPLGNDMFIPFKVMKQDNNRLIFIGAEWSIDGGSYTILRTFMDGFIDTSFANQGRFFEQDLNPGEAIIVEDGGIVEFASNPFFTGPQKLVLFKLLNSPLGIEENKKSLFTVSPNPSNNFITISCTECSLINQPYQIIDATGKIMIQDVFNMENPTISFESFSAGLYYLTIDKTTIKLIKR